MSFRCRCFHSHKDSAVMTQIKTAHGVPVVKNCCVTNEIKCLKTKQFPFLLVHAWKEGGISYFFWAFFPFQQLSVTSTFEILPRPCCCLPIPWATNSTKIVQNQHQQVQLWQRAQEVTSKANLSQVSIACLALRALSIALSDLWGNPRCPESLFWKVWFRMQPPALKQPESCDSYRYGLCIEVPWMYPS